jgi:phenylacetate-CoA ligase
VLAIWGAERDLALDTSYRRKFYEQRLMRRFPAPAGQVSDAVFSSFLEKLNRHRPKVLYGYSATMARFAEFVQQSGHAYHRPRIIIATAETLTDVDRQILEKVFGCRVNEQYGSRDIGMVATECHEHSGLHFHPAACFVEFVYAGEIAEGPMHRLIITDLYNYGMPLIRYDTDDCVLPEKTPCVCGSWFPRVRRILGRGLDNFLLTDGTQVPGIALTVHMARISGGFRHVSQVQVIQRSLNRITIRYAAKGNEEDIKKELFRLRDCIQELLKTRLHFTYDRVPEILRERSGKLRLCISEINKTTWPQLS